MIVDREHFLSAFRQDLANCAAGQGGSLVLTGPLASGKTALLAAFATEASDAGFLCLTASGSRAERGLSLGVISQLCQNTPSLIKPALRVHRTAPSLPAIYQALVELSGQNPVLISIDDLHHVDRESLQYLVYLVRRIGSSRVLLVTAGRDLVPPTQLSLYNDLLDHATSSRLRLTPLTLGGVARLLHDRLAEPPSPALIADCHEATRGNPLLVSALAQDLAGQRDADRTGSDGQLPAGPAFQQAIRRCLYRCEPGAQRILRAGALLDEALHTATVPPALTGQLAEVDPGVIERTLSQLEAIGLLQHPVAKQTILETLSASDLATLQLRAAQLLREEGLPPLIIARHLLAAGRPVDGWAIPVLRGVATRSLDQGDTALAIRLLHLAHNSSTDETDRAALKALLFRAEWRTDPASAGHRLPDLTAAMDQGLLSVADSLATVGHLLWFGFPAEAERALAQLGGQGEHPAQGDLRLASAWAAYSYPSVIGQPERELDGLKRSSSLTTNNRELLADALEAILTKGSCQQALTTAEQTLQSSRLDDITLIPICAALTALIYTNQLETAALWCDRLMDQATEQHAPGWQATFAGLSATVALRQGRLVDVETRARLALGDRLAGRGRSAGSAPVAMLLRALTAMGRLTEAGRLLELPLPDDLFQTVAGLAFLQARGQYYLAIDRPDPALDDFLTCGSLMADWDLDLPEIVPWRLDAAQAQFRLGATDQARSLIDDQLAHPGAVSDRIRGRALRLLAGGRTLPQRTELLLDAVELLQICGDRLELAYALADLGHAYRALGDPQRARSAVRRAWQVAQECHAHALCRSLPDFSDDTPTRPPTDAPTSAEALSAAERRVAALASAGRTNHQIARKLFISESTVEQHLTRVYRKLKVKRRAHLPASLQGVGEDMS